MLRNRCKERLRRHARCPRLRSKLALWRSKSAIALRLNLRRPKCRLLTLRDCAKYAALSLLRRGAETLLWRCNEPLLGRVTEGRLLRPKALLALRHTEALLLALLDSKALLRRGPEGGLLSTKALLPLGRAEALLPLTKR